MYVSHIPGGTAIFKAPERRKATVVNPVSASTFSLGDMNREEQERKHDYYNRYI